MAQFREARVEDVDAIYEMLLESAEEQGHPDELVVTRADLREDGFGAEPKFQVLIVAVDDIVAGMGLYFFTYSTWGSRRGLYLEDLYVRRSFRQQGLARALLARLAQIAEQHGCGRFQWVVHSDNSGAVRLYKSVGAQSLDDWRLMSLKGAGIRRLASLT